MRWWVERGIFDNNREQNLRCWSCKCHHVNARQKRETDVQLLVTVSCKVNVTKAIHEKKFSHQKPFTTKYRDTHNERVKKRQRSAHLSAATHETEKATATGLLVLVHDAA
jgi:hypothetical protein